MRIAYLTDSHLDATGNGFHQQTPWVGGVDVLMERLRRWVDEQRIDVVIHGGDLIENGLAEQMPRALDHLAALERPCLICLGNHDICRPQAYGQWLEHVDRYPAISLADRRSGFDECDLYLLNNHWQDGREPEMYWDPAPPYRHQPCLSSAQLDWLDQQLSHHADRPAILAVHTQIEPVPPNEPDLEIYIPPHYPDQLNAVLDKHSHCMLVLSGHCHVTTARPRNGRMHLTTAAFTEAPFHVRLIDVRENVMTVQTHALGPTPDCAAFDESRAWAIGEQADRDFILPICNGCA